MRTKVLRLMQLDKLGTSMRTPPMQRKPALLPMKQRLQMKITKPFPTRILLQLKQPKLQQVRRTKIQQPH